MTKKPPHSAYALIIASYLTFFSLVAALAGRKRRLSAEFPPGRDLLIIGLATFRLSRLVAHDRVTSVLRLPFVEEGKGEEQIEGTKEQPKGRGLQLAVGQLLNCSWCASIWAGTFNVGVYTLFPRLGRLFLLVLSSSGIAEMLDPIFPMLNYLSGYIQEKQKVLKGEEPYGPGRKSADGRKAAQAPRPHQEQRAKVAL
jgi:hypothetical protein